MKQFEKSYYMRGMLSFFILWLLSKKSMHGQEIAEEVAKRKGVKPSPGTLYPALNELEKRKLIKGVKKGRTITYSLTDNGRKSIEKSMDYFCKAFGEIFKNHSRK